MQLVDGAEPYVRADRLAEALGGSVTRAAERGERVLHARGNLRVRSAQHEAVGLERGQRLREHLLAHAMLRIRTHQVHARPHGCERIAKLVRKNRDEAVLASI